jgi:hypothetical protein
MESALLLRHATTASEVRARRDQEVILRTRLNLRCGLLWQAHEVIAILSWRRFYALQTGTATPCHSGYPMPLEAGVSCRLFHQMHQIAHQMRDNSSWIYSQ